MAEHIIQLRQAEEEVLRAANRWRDSKTLESDRRLESAVDRLRALQQPQPNWKVSRYYDPHGPVTWDVNPTHTGPGARCWTPELAELICKLLNEAEK
jgi:hypothetical protein